jgi:hypothetical protein
MRQTAVVHNSIFTFIGYVNVLVKEKILLREKFYSKFLLPNN